jgi:hypothetical protein
MTEPQVLTILAKQWIEGDDSLLRLSRVRLEEAGLGGELYPDTPEQLRHQFQFCPPGRPCTVHLPRNLNLLDAGARGRVAEFAATAAHRVHGMIVHDHGQFAERPDDAVAGFRDLDRRLAAVAGSPLVFVEYAAGLTPELFASLFERTVDLSYVATCIDVSHVGIRACQTGYARRFPGVDVCSFKHAPQLRDFDAIQEVVLEARGVVVELVRRIAALRKPLHFHLHDGHPLSTMSRYGVSDHLSFLQTVPLPFEHGGRRLVGGIFGLAGLRSVVAAARSGRTNEPLTFMIEVHPQPGRSPLGRHAHLFSHWKDATNAEQMNYWLDAMLVNAGLVRDAWAAE